MSKVLIEVMVSTFDPKHTALSIDDIRFGPDAGPWKVTHTFRVDAADLERIAVESQDSDMNDRIRLAEAMGWQRIKFDNSYPQQRPWRSPDKSRNTWKDAPDPFTDANDDYAVLEWARRNLDASGYESQWYRFCSALWVLFQEAQGTTADQSRTLGHYRVGFYARAALKVIDNE